MDANRRPTHPAAGVDPPATATATGDDWRAQIQPEGRTRVVNKIMVTLKKHLPVSTPEGLNQLQKVAVRFEDKIYTEATSLSDYVRKISIKMCAMETQTQQAPGNAPVIPNQNNSSKDVEQVQATTSVHESPIRTMDSNRRTTQGSDPAAGVDPPPTGGDWRTQLQPKARSRIVNKIMEDLKKHLPVSVSEDLNELQKVAVRFEEKIYTEATNQPDYLRKICSKMLYMEMKKQQAPGNAQMISYQNNSGKVPYTVN